MTLQAAWQSNEFFANRDGEFREPVAQSWLPTAGSGDKSMTIRAFGGSGGAATATDRRALSAAFCLAVRFGLHEGIDNHFSLAIDGERFLINPYGTHWSQLRARDLLVVDGSGRVLEGDGEVEATALHIHAAIHRRHPDARCVLHTHMP